MGFRPPKPKCQCDPSCKRTPLPNSPFCKVHQNNCWRKAPLSDSELPYQPDEYNKNEGMLYANNCYAYATGYDELPNDCTKQKCNAPFPQPGLSSGHVPWSKVDGKRCPDVLGRVLGDIPGSYLARFTQKCKPGMRKIAFHVDPKRDYHVTRQDIPRKHSLQTNGPDRAWWSHKSGSTEVKDVDALGRPIYDPRLAQFHTEDGELQYIHFCDYVCIPEKKPRLTRGSSRRRARTKRTTLRKRVSKGTHKRLRTMK